MQFGWNTSAWGDFKTFWKISKILTSKKYLVCLLFFFYSFSMEFIVLKIFISNNLNVHHESCLITVVLLFTDIFSRVPIRQEVLRSLSRNTLWMLIRHWLSVEAATQPHYGGTRVNGAHTLLSCLGSLLWIFEHYLKYPWLPTALKLTKQETLCIPLLQGRYMCSIPYWHNLPGFGILPSFFDRSLGSSPPMVPSAPPWLFCSESVTKLQCLTKGAWEHQFLSQIYLRLPLSGCAKRACNTGQRWSKFSFFHEGYQLWSWFSWRSAVVLSHV